MRILIIILIGLITEIIPLFGAAPHAAVRDSVRLNLDHQQKVSTLLWVEVGSLKDVDNFPSHRHFLFSEDSKKEKLPPGLNLSFARRLDASMNPATDQDLPDLSLLAAINDSHLIEAYFDFFRELGTSLNYQYLILPQTDNPREKLLIEQLHEFDPGYFILPSSIRSGMPEKRKEIKTLFEAHDFWLVGSEDYPRAARMIQKLDDKILLNGKDELIRQTFYNTLVQHSVPVPVLSSSLKLALRKASVALIEKESILPLRSDTLCLITQNPYGNFANMLRNYAYLITETEAIIESQAPILADHNPLFHELYTNRIKIYAGEIEGFDSSFFDAGLIICKADDIYDYLLPQQLFGSLAVTGSISEELHLLNLFSARSLEPNGKLGFAPSESVGLNQYHLDSIARIIQEGIAEQAFPGCQIALAVGGSVIYNKAFGHLTYDNLIPVYPSTVFDLASVTKVAATSMMAMKLYEERLLDLDQTISYYLPWYVDSNKKDITIKSLLAHQAGLLPYVPFWKRVLSGDFLEPFYYESIYDEVMDQRSYGNLEPASIMRDSLTQWIRTSSLLKYDSVPYYSYSDIGFMILQQVLEEIVCMPMDKYLHENFYQPLGLRKTLFNPRKYAVNLFEIAPTEYDSYYRSEQIWGEVHDRNAAILDGVAGHAGLFSNARDMLILFQMALQGGNYDGKNFFSKETLDIFNQQYFPDNRRGLGWDKKSEVVRNVSDYASDESFGHTGFTGTMVWVDPQYDLVFIFLSNRIHPNANNRKLNEMDIRTRIQDIVYQAIQAKSH